MEQSTQTDIIERPKTQGRPKATALFTEEENKERARQRAILYYSLNFEKERERKRLEYQAKEILFRMLFFDFYFLLISI